jgi:hypothetical protein
LHTTHTVSFPQLVKNHLASAISKSKRRGTWFSLDRSEKSTVYLAIRLDVKFSSLDLLRALTRILKKLQQRGETAYAWLQRGTMIAWAFSEFAVSTGNESAIAWRNDRSYALFLGRVFVNSFGGHRYT